MQGCQTPSFKMIPTPREIFASYERGEIEREELHSLMALHARELIQEMEEDHLNPAAAWLESLRARRAASRLVKLHGVRLMREVLGALADIPEFPPVRHLWNSDHPDVPLHCFLRIRRKPVFRILCIAARSDGFQVIIEHGDGERGKGTKQSFILKRDVHWRLKAEPI